MTAARISAASPSIRNRSGRWIPRGSASHRVAICQSDDRLCCVLVCTSGPSAAPPPLTRYAARRMIPAVTPARHACPRPVPSPRPEQQRAERQDEHQLDEGAGGQHQPGPAGTPVFEQQGAGEQGEADHEVVVSAVHHQQQRGVQPDERERDGVTGPAPDDHERPAQGEGLEELEQQSGRQLGRPAQRGAGRRQRHEPRTVDRTGVAPAARHELDDRIVREVRGHVRERTHVVHGDQPAVHRVGPDVVRTGRRCEHRDQDEEAGRRDHSTAREHAGPDRRHEQSAERTEREQRGDDAAGRSEAVIADDGGGGGDHQHHEEQVAHGARPCGIGPAGRDMGS